MRQGDFRTFLCMPIYLVKKLWTNILIKGKVIRIEVFVHWFHYILKALFLQNLHQFHYWFDFSVSNPFKEVYGAHYQKMVLIKTIKTIN